MLLIAVIIATHSFVAYSDHSNAWPHQTVQEVRLSGVTDAVLRIPTVAGALFAMGLFFLISGLVTPGSLERKGPTEVRRRPDHPAGDPAGDLSLYLAGPGLGHLSGDRIQHLVVLGGVHARQPVPRTEADVVRGGSC